jgi:hypothetical protein
VSGVTEREVAFLGTLLGSIFGGDQNNLSRGEGTKESPESHLSPSLSSPRSYDDGVESSEMNDVNYIDKRHSERVCCHKHHLDAG